MQQYFNKNKNAIGVPKLTLKLKEII